MHVECYHGKTDPALSRVFVLPRSKDIEKLIEKQAPIGGDHP
jgi:hypothetical protein